MIFRILTPARRSRGKGPRGRVTGQRMGMTEFQRARPGGQAQTEGETEAAALDSGLPRLSSRALFRAAREIIIEHDGADYRLRLTANGKLILTK